MMQVSAAGGLDSGREGRGWVGGTLGEELTGFGDGVQVGSEKAMFLACTVGCWIPSQGEEPRSRLVGEISQWEVEWAVDTWVWSSGERSEL